MDEKCEGKSVKDSRFKDSKTQGPRKRVDLGRYKRQNKTPWEV